MASAVVCSRSRFEDREAITAQIGTAGAIARGLVHFSQDY
jgi:hypothetical protein